MTYKIRNSFPNTMCLKISYYIKRILKISFIHDIQYHTNVLGVVYKRIKISLIVSSFLIGLIYDLL